MRVGSTREKHRLKLRTILPLSASVSCSFMKSFDRWALASCSAQGSLGILLAMFLMVAGSGVGVLGADSPKVDSGLAAKPSVVHYPPANATVPRFLAAR